MLRGSTVCAKAFNAQTAIAWFMGFEGAISCVFLLIFLDSETFLVAGC
jgi:hypothetical protein